jgi:hypothetical protein
MQSERRRRTSGLETSPVIIMQEFVLTRRQVSVKNRRSTTGTEKDVQVLTSKKKAQSLTCLKGETGIRTSLIRVVSILPYLTIVPSD